MPPFIDHAWNESNPSKFVSKINLTTPTWQQFYCAQPGLKLDEGKGTFTVGADVPESPLAEFMFSFGVCSFLIIASDQFCIAGFCCCCRWVLRHISLCKTTSKCCLIFLRNKWNSWFLMPCENTFGINVLLVPVSCCQAHFLLTRILKLLLHKKVFKKKQNSRLLSNHLLLQVIWWICWFVSSRSDKVTGKAQAEERIKYSHKNRYSSVISCPISYLHAFLEADPARYRFKIRRDRIFRDQTHSGFIL